jgi:hypothetical protein
MKSCERKRDNIQMRSAGRKGRGHFGLAMPTVLLAGAVLCLAAEGVAQEEAAPQIKRMPASVTPQTGRWQVTVTEAPHKVIAVDTDTGTTLVGGLSGTGIQWDKLYDLPETAALLRARQLAEKEKREKEEKRLQGLTQEQRDEEELQKVLLPHCRKSPQIFVVTCGKGEQPDEVCCKVTEFLQGEGFSSFSEEEGLPNAFSAFPTPTPILKVGDEYNGLNVGKKTAKAGDWCVVFQGNGRIYLGGRVMSTDPGNFIYQPNAVFTRDWKFNTHRFIVHKNPALTVDGVKAVLKKLSEEK